jgi:hypothetical protein
MLFRERAIRKIYAANKRIKRSRGRTRGARPKCPWGTKPTTSEQAKELWKLAKAGVGERNGLLTTSSLRDNFWDCEWVVSGHRIAFLYYMEVLLYSTLLLAKPGSWPRRIRQLEAFSCKYGICRCETEAMSNGKPKGGVKPNER